LPIFVFCDASLAYDMFVSYFTRYCWFSATMHSKHFRY